MLSLLNVTTIVMKEAGGVEAIIGPITSFTSSIYNMFSEVAGGIATIAVAVVMIKLLISSDAQSVAKAKSAGVVIAVALFGIKCAPTIVSAIQDVASQANGTETQAVESESTFEIPDVIVAEL